MRNLTSSLMMKEIEGLKVIPTRQSTEWLLLVILNRHRQLAVARMNVRISIMPTRYLLRLTVLNRVKNRFQAMKMKRKTILMKNFHSWNLMKQIKQRQLKLNVNWFKLKVLMTRTSSKVFKVNRLKCQRIMKLLRKLWLWGSRIQMKSTINFCQLTCYSCHW